MDFVDLNQHRLTKIVCTLGPACFGPEKILELAKCGMDVARLNVSHGGREEHIQVLKDIDEINEKNDLCIAALIDTRGAEIRTGDVQDPIVITKGVEVIFAPTTLEGKLKYDKQIIFVGYDGFSSDVGETDKILIDNGEISFKIVSINEDGSVLGKADQDGSVGSRRHINLPGADIDLPSITDKDWDDIRYAAENNIDYVALSFIRNAEEVNQVRAVIDKANSTTQIITKIETQKAVKNLKEIVEASDGIMVARGDLGAEVPFEHLPVIQNEIIWRCRDAGKPVIVATHMLESMKEHPIPTRAEVTDVAYAAMERTDSTMLSGETASGKHPPVAVSAMDRILRATETQLSRFPLEEAAVRDDADAKAQSAVNLAKSSHAKAILVFTRQGFSARRVSKFRPYVPIVALCEDLSVLRKLKLVYGVMPIKIKLGDIEETVHEGMKKAKDAGILQKGDNIIVISDTRTKGEAVTSIQMRTIE
ncbi:pyruvate kinase [Candidatus Peregrinibacteria bacterium]|mgnify:CR=1 FL=1|nr:pyruvate kinase [Candidatus Peregrinibacteria bacterium]